jgi:hypothetical protein
LNSGASLVAKFRRVASRCGAELGNDLAGLLPQSQRSADASHRVADLTDVDPVVICC